MKKIFFYASVVLIAASCNNKGEETKTATADSTATVSNEPAKPAPELAYTLDHPYGDWQPGNAQNTATAMNALKGFATNNIAESLTNFGDSVRIRMDNYDEKVSHDSLNALFTTWRNNYSTVVIHMEDYLSVISKDKKDEWVTMWYKQINTDKKGKVDSVYCVDDVKLANGKIIVLEEAVRKYAVKKK